MWNSQRIDQEGDKTWSVKKDEIKLKRKKKQYCDNCGVELTTSNKYMEGMCMECKCGIDYEEK